MEGEYRLLRSQKNRLFEIILSFHLEPANFTWIEENLMPNVDAVVPRLNYLGGDYFFRFMLHEGKHLSRFRPGLDTPIQNGQRGDWDVLTTDFQVWLHCVRRETAAPDLWQEMHKYQTSVSLAIPEQASNEPIPAYEAEQIASKLQQLADKMEEQFELNQEQNQFVRGKLNYLEAAAKQQRGRDWVHLAIGVCVTIAMAVRVPPERVSEFWELVGSLLGDFIHLLGS